MRTYLDPEGIAAALSAERARADAAGYARGIEDAAHEIDKYSRKLDCDDYEDGWNNAVKSLAVIVRALLPPASPETK
jgi:hypothetical protein